MRSKLAAYFIILMGLCFCVACKEQNKRKEVGKEGIVEITEGRSKYAADYERASRLLQENKTAEAIAIYVKLTKIEAENQQTNVYGNLGSAYLQANDYEKAIGNYNQSIRLNSKNCESYVGMGSVYFRLNDYKNAIRYYSIAKGLDTSNSDSVWGLAISYDALGITDSAKINATRFIELEPGSKYREFLDPILKK